ncbi:MAG TPA: hypothetical protein V6D02_08215 [Candidatus Obscuribacterales bacterium]
MKLVEKTATKRLYVENPDPGLQLVERFFSWLVVGFPVVVLGCLAYISGTVALQCDRPKPAIVTCDLHRTRFWGRYPLPADPLGRITGAVINADVRTDSDGNDRTVNVLYAVGHDGQQHALELPASRANVDRLNEFVTTDLNTRLVLQQDNYRLNGGLAIAAGVLGLYGLRGLQRQPPRLGQLEFDKIQQQVRLQIATPQQPPRLLKELSLVGVTAIALAEPRDADDDVSYAAVMHTPGHQPFTLCTTTERQPIADMVADLQAFLALPAPATPSPAAIAAPTGQPTPAATATPAPAPTPAPAAILHRTAAGVTYAAYDRACLTPSQHHDLDVVETALQQLQFEPLGSLTTTRFANLVIHGYRHPQWPIAAIITQTASLQPMIDFYSTLGQGASLTTSTMPGVGDLPRCGIFRNAYPQGEPAVLLRHHRDRLHQLSQAQGRPQPAAHDLPELAKAIEAYLQRQPSGLWHQLKTYTVQLAIQLFKPHWVNKERP